MSRRAWKRDRWVITDASQKGEPDTGNRNGARRDPVCALTCMRRKGESSTLSNGPMRPLVAMYVPRTIYGITAGKVTMTQTKKNIPSPPPPTPEGRVDEQCNVFFLHLAERRGPACSHPAAHSRVRALSEDRVKIGWLGPSSTPGEEE